MHSENQSVASKNMDVKPKRRNPAIEMIAGASSILAVGASLWTYIESKVYKNMSSLGMFDDMKPKRRDIAKNILHNAESKRISSKDSFQFIDDLIEANEAEARQRFRSIGVNNIFDRWKLLRKHQKIEALVISGAAGGIALGSILPIAQNLLSPKETEPKELSHAEKLQEQTTHDSGQLNR